MAKYKIKNKLNKLNSITICIIVILFSMTIGYSLWEDSQVITGTIKARYVEPKLENILFDDDTNFEDTGITDKNYISDDEDLDIWGSDRIDFMNSTIVETVNANTNKIELIGNFDIETGWVTAGRTTTYTFYVKNNNPVPMTSGGYTFLEKTIKYEPTFTMPTEIAPGGYGEFKISMRMKGNTDMDWGKIVHKFHYKVGEVTRYAYVTVDMIK
jgi:hypothetical protein